LQQERFARLGERSAVARRQALDFHLRHRRDATGCAGR
jgi:hypothetical protein